jgi:hypothetical protein
MVAIMKAKEIILRVGVEVAGDLTIRSRQKWTTAKQIPFRRCPNSQ